MLKKEKRTYWLCVLKDEEEVIRQANGMARRWGNLLLRDKTACHRGMVEHILFKMPDYKVRFKEVKRKQ